MKRIRWFPKRNIILIVVGILFFLWTVFALWEFTLHAAVSMVTRVNDIEFLFEPYK